MWAENAPAVRAFLAVETQWRAARGWDGRMELFGLDYAGARAGLELAGIEADPGLWTQIRVIEAAAKAEMNGAG